MFLHVWKECLCFYLDKRYELKEPKKQRFNKIQSLDVETKQIQCRNKWYVVNWQSEALQQFTEGRFPIPVYFKIKAGDFCFPERNMEVQIVLEKAGVFRSPA